MESSHALTSKVALFVLTSAAFSRAHASVYPKPLSSKHGSRIAFRGHALAHDVFVKEVGAAAAVHNSQGELWLGSLRAQSGNQTCLVTKQVGVNDIQGKHCPASCPLYVQDKTDDKFCSFHCVPATIEACSAYNPNAPVPDSELGVCRACKISGCGMCANDGTDTCSICKAGYDLVDGKCNDHRRLLWYIILLVLGTLVTVIATWILNLAFRPITNEDGLDRGLDTRSAAKLHRPREKNVAGVPLRSPRKRDLWPWKPWEVDLCGTPVAGLGVMHMFNFEFALIAWAGLVAVAWLLLAVFVDMDLLRLGTKDPGKTPRDHCIIVQWGFITQQRLMCVYSTRVALLEHIIGWDFFNYCITDSFALVRFTTMPATFEEFCTLESS